MTDARWIMLLVAALTGGVMLAAPHLAPRGIFFGVRTGEAFAQSAEAANLLRRYRMWVAAATLAAAAIIWAFSDSVFALIAAAGGTQIVSLAAFLQNYFALKPHAEPLTAPPEDPAEAAERLPLWAALSAPPFILPVAAMLYLHAHWAEIPGRYPVHFGVDGTPNRWVTRSDRAVYAPLWFAEGLLLLMLLLGFAMVRGSRRSARQTGIPQVFIAVMYLIGALFAGIGVSPILRLPPPVMIAATLVFVVAILVYSVAMMSRPESSSEATPDDCWTLGGIYNNPNDPALFVQKRIGYGLTVNFGNPWAWVVMGGFFLGVAALVAYLIWAQR